jgi:hypothetical protein
MRKRRRMRYNNDHKQKMIIVSKENDHNIDINNNKMEIEKGIDFILSLFNNQEPFLFPRRISTFKSKDKQFLVRSKEEIINAFADSSFVDCRINAYPYMIDYKGIQRYLPNFIFIDLDRNNNNFKTDRSFEFTLSNTLTNIKEIVDGCPTVLFTGGGYHIYQPIYCPSPLENVTEFQKFDKPSQEFLRFAKDNLSNGKADKNNNPSFKSCLLRIPESINSKYNKKVKIVQIWNGIRPSIPRKFIEEFRSGLIQKKIDENKQRQKMGWKLKRQNKNKDTINRNFYEWIDKKILANPFSDYRKIIINLILAPYLIVIKKLSYEESSLILNEWLQKCDSLRKLDFNPEYLVKSALSIAIQKAIPPMKLVTLKDRNLELYNILHEL